MNKIFLCLLLMFLSGVTFAQTAEERILYVVDSIPVIENPDEADNVTNEDIDHIEVVTNAARIKAMGYEGKIDKVIFVTTKAYLDRSAEVNLIPTTKTMHKESGRWYLKNAKEPYSGPIIDYFVNGKKQGEGKLKNGIVEGPRTVYYLNGNKRYFYTYTDGIQDGPSEEYFINGKLRQKGSFAKGQETGLWQVFYSTEKLKRQSTVVNGKQDVPKEGKKFFGLLDKAIALMKEDDYSGAIKRLDEAEKINAGYADVYFYRGTAKLNKFDFDNAVADLDKAISIEPLYMEAISNRAFTRLRKYQFKDSRVLSKNIEVTVLAAKDKVPIPKEDLEKICADLNLGYQLGDRKPMIIDAMKTYCK
jgi:antitoxin component YwqK of YwqJK toxin-antitoxin module